MKNLKPFIGLVDAAVSLFIKIRDARKSVACSHLLLLAHHNVPDLEHKNEAYCACKPTYQCFLCQQIFEPRNGYYYCVTR